MNVFRCSFALALLSSLACGCVIDLDDAFDTPSTDGPFEIQVDVEQGLDPTLVRAGLFDETATDEQGAPIEAELDVLVSVEGKAKLDDADRPGTVYFKPLEMLSPDAAGSMVVPLPGEAAEDDGFRLIVWYDEDGDGLLSLDEDGTGEFARAPSRIFPKEGQTMVLTDIWANHADDTDPEGKWVASAALRDDSGEKPSYHENWIADRELTGWTVSIEASRFE